jgi:hypothetical protein
VVITLEITLQLELEWGFVSEPARDGWTVGAPAFCGDYFLPGSPVEGWGVEVAGQSYLNSNLGGICSSNQIAGAISSYTYSNGQTDVIWNGAIAAGAGTGLTFSQQTTVYDNNLFFVTTVRICNTSGAAKTNVYYTRNVDPDNDIMISGSYQTRDTIVSQPSGSSCEALVTSRGWGGNCFLGLGTLASNARVSMGGFNLVAPLSNYYNGIGFEIREDSTQAADQAVQVSYYWPTIAAGQCVEISYAYVLSRADLGIAFTKLGNPSFFSAGRDISTTLKDTVCRNEPTTLSVVDDASLTWSWSPAAVLSTTTGTTTVVRTSAPVTITATAYRGTCQAFSRQIQYFIDTSIRLGIGIRDTQICAPNLPVRLSTTLTYDTLRRLTPLCDSYGVAGIPHSPLTLTSPVSVTLGDDQLSNCLPIGFPFKFFCIDYKNFYISSNGFISFTAGTGHGCCAGQVLPNAAAPNNLVALAWEDLDPSSGGTITYQTLGVAPNRILVVSFSNVRHKGGGSGHPVTGQIHLYETTNRIEVHLASMPGPGSGNNAHTVGIENATGTRGFAPAGFNGVVGWTATNLAWRFTPGIRVGAPLPLTFSWSPTTGLSATNIPNPIATTAITRSYRICVSNGYCVNVCDTAKITVGPFNIVRNMFICSGDTLRVGSHAYTSSGTYRDTFISLHGCDSIVRTNLTVSSISTSATRRDTICPGSNTVINGITYTTPGTYYDTLNNFRGCDSILTVIISYAPAMTFTGTRDTTICTGQSVQLTVTPTLPETYLHNWRPGGTLNDSLISNPIASPTINTTYIDSIKSRWCSFFDTINVSIASYPIVNASVTPSVHCSGDTVILSARDLSYPPSYTYSWTPTTGLFNRTDTSTVRHVVSSPRSYYVDVNNAGCITRDTVTINPRIDVRVTPDTTICAGQPVRLNALISYDTIRVLGTVRCDSYSVASITYAPLATTGTSISLGDDQVSGAIPIGFNFNFFCNTYTNAYISSNGFITFNATSGSGCCSGQAIPNASDPNDLIALAWDDLYPPGAGSITYYTTGVAPNRQFVVNYNGIPLCCGAVPAVTGQIILFETSNRAEIHITSAVGVSPGTAGIENALGTKAFIAPGLNSTAWPNPLNNTSYSFSPISLADSIVPLTFSWSPTTGLSSSTVLNPLATTSITRNYVITASAGLCLDRDTASITVRAKDTVTLNITICSNQTYSFNGVNRNTTGTYRDTLLNSNGCDSLIILNLTVNPTRTGTINATICSNQTYSFNGVNRNTTGSYLDTFTAINGCDSVVTLNLTVNPTRIGTINATICSNQTYSFNGVNRNTTGSYLDTFTAINGCDSVVTLNLTVNPTRTGTINATICSNQTYNFNGVNRNTTGSYLDTFTAVNGCDSVVTLNLTVNPTRTGTINATICSNQTYSFNGVNRNTTGAYLDTFTAVNGCDSVVTLNLTVNPTRTGTINATICSNQTYNFNGVNRNTTGAYLDTFTAVNGCDSVVTLNLTVNPTRTGTINATICSNQTYSFNGVNRNTTGAYLDTFTAVNGCDSVVTLNLTVNPTRTGTINATICSNQTYSFNGVNRNTTGSYLDTFTAINGCDSVVTLNLTVNPTRTGTINATICSNQTYSFNGVNRNTTGSYLDTFTAVNGCDSVVTLNLTVNPTRTGTINATICSNQTYNFNGVNRNTTGSYLDTFTAVNGCDSVVTLNLTVNPTRTGTINATICSNQTYSFNGVNRNTTGSYLDTFTAVNGCDSVVTLNLTVNPTRTGTINATICSNQTYSFNGVNRNTTGSYLDTFTAVNGCDSVVTLNLTVNPTRTGTINATICSNQTYNFNGVNRNTTGSYLDTFTAVNGCDSVVTLNLTVNPTRTGTINATICSNQTYSFNGVNRNTSGSYLDTFTAVNGCDSVVTLNLTVNPTRTGTINATICSNQTYSFNGVNRNTTGSYLDTFTAVNGCDSVVTLNLTVNPTRTGTINALQFVVIKHIVLTE